MSTIRGTMNLFPRPEDYQPCIWCGGGTDSRMITPARPDLGTVPCHVGCAAAIVVAFDEYRSARHLNPAALPPPRLEALLTR